MRPTFAAHACRPPLASRALYAALLTLIALSALDARAAATPELPPPPILESLRGKPAATVEELTRKNGDARHHWLEQLSPEQRAAWFAAMGQRDPQQERRFGAAKLPAVASGYDWRTVARFSGLGPAEIAQLDRDKLLLEDISLRQSFQAYTQPLGPVFITSDSALNAFHVLFEDSFRELELRRAFTLRTHLENVVNKTRELLADKYNAFPAAELAPGWRHAQLVVGPALRLLGTPVDFFDADTRDEIEQQVGKIRAATAVELPAWLAPASRTLLAIDYRRCTPVGFYTDSESLQNYFRAVRWLQSIPFRADRDDELTAIGLLGDAVMQRGDERFFFRDYATFLGRPDDPAISEAAYEFQNFLSADHDASEWKSNLIAKRRWLLRSTIALDDWKKLSDALRLPPDAAEKLAEIQFRVLSAYRLPDSLALAKLSEPGHLPSGLAVAALLGSDFARRQLSAVEPAQLDAALSTAREDWHPTKEGERRARPSLYDRYLDTLAALHAPAEPDAPAFMRNDAWAAKSCLTTLASWAQMRHTFTLQAKQSIMYLGICDTPPGFIEPNPEFFRRLADLVESAEHSLDEADVFLPSANAEAEELRSQASQVEAFGFHREEATPALLKSLTPQETTRYERLIESIDSAVWADDHAFSEDINKMTPAAFQKLHRDLIANLRSHAADLASGKTNLAPPRSTSRERWDTLKSLTRRLEALAHKQLRRQPWSRDEENFIRNYGAQLALVHGYFGNSWLTPRDDAPRWASVARDPSSYTQLAVGVGRARLIHVLYPYGDGEVLCTGSVMSYYEYPEAGTPLTDTEWRAKLDGPQAPSLPAWLAPYLAR